MHTGSALDHWTHVKACRSNSLPHCLHVFLTYKGCPSRLSKAKSMKDCNCSKGTKGELEDEDGLMSGAPSCGG